MPDPSSRGAVPPRRPRCECKDCRFATYTLWGWEYLRAWSEESSVDD